MLSTMAYVCALLCSTCYYFSSITPTGFKFYAVTHSYSSRPFLCALVRGYMVKVKRPAPRTCTHTWLKLPALCHWVMTIKRVLMLWGKNRGEWKGQQLSYVFTCNYDNQTGVVVAQWLSTCGSSVAEHWLHKPGVLGSIPGNFHYFTSKYLYLISHGMFAIISHNLKFPLIISILLQDAYNQWEFQALLL